MTDQNVDEGAAPAAPGARPSPVPTPRADAVAAEVRARIFALFRELLPEGVAVRLPMQVPIMLPVVGGSGFAPGPAQAHIIGLMQDRVIFAPQWSGEDEKPWALPLDHAAFPPHKLLALARLAEGAMTLARQQEEGQSAADAPSWEIWVEPGSWDTTAAPTLLGTSQGTTFEDAVRAWYRKHGNAAFHAETLTVWGSRHFPSEAEARTAAAVRQ